MLLNRLNANVKVYFGGSWQGGNRGEKKKVYIHWLAYFTYLFSFPSFLSLFVIMFFFSTSDLGVGRCSSVITVGISRFIKVRRDSPGMVRYGMIEITLLISVNSRFIVYHRERKILNSDISLVRGAFLSSHG